MREAARLLIDHAQAKMMEEVFPLVVDVLKVHFQQQLDAADQGQPVDLTWAKMVLDGMYVTNSPQLKAAESTTPTTNQEPQSLEGFIAFRQHNIPPPVNPTPTLLDTFPVEDKPVEAEVIDKVVEVVEVREDNDAEE